MVRRVTSKQLANLARGREKLFQKQLRQHGMNPNFRSRPPVIVQREVVRQPVINQNTIHQHNTEIKLSLFRELIGAKIFTIETNSKKENLNLLDMINRINARLNLHWQKISLNQQKISEIISYMNARDKEFEEKIKKLERRIEELEKNETTN